ncbi:MAG: tRNA preQ1(34) S-adenosylmethionine ribosyltransferase-isomerase QueA [Pantanalinema sp. GBBB05]|nr:tRNA preQ1(34) S-adenosylmethionine ribosyltransferase-isomerase QueA [Pantanalinema sp. GBBB05]
MTDHPDYQLAAYDYVLPEARIAQSPAIPRDSSRLLVVKNRLEHCHASFRELPNFLHPGDLLVLNNTRVIPARLYGQKSSGLPVEVLLLEPQPSESTPTDGFSDRWLALVKPGRRLKPGARIWFSHHRQSSSSPPSLSAAEGIWATVLATDPTTSGRIIQFEVPPGLSLQDWIYQMGQLPLPPYITQLESEPEQYQTVYAACPGAVAAPTAGLHFTPELLQQLQACGIQQAFVTLHVGVGTFRPVEAENITNHQMHSEWVEVPAATVEQIQTTKAQGGRVIAVGTTVVRSLEGIATQLGKLQPFCGKTNLFIYPGYQWQVIDGMITNFHLPKSSLMMLVSALISRRRLLDLYQVAIAEHYRFYSFGDAMLILPESRISYD